MADSLGIALAIDSGLTEFDFGDLMGRDWSKSPYREQLDSVLADPTQRRPGGESMIAFASRVRAALGRVESGAGGRVTMIVAHGMTNRVVAGFARGEPLGVTARLPSQGSGVVYRLSVPVGRGAVMDSLRY